MTLISMGYKWLLPRPDLYRASALHQSRRSHLKVTLCGGGPNDASGLPDRFGFMDLNKKNDVMEAVCPEDRLCPRQVINYRIILII